MRLQLARSMNALLEEGLFFDSQIYTPEDGAGDTEPRLKVAFIVDRRQPADTEVVRRMLCTPAAKSRRLLPRRPAVEP